MPKIRAFELPELTDADPQRMSSGGYLELLNFTGSQELIDAQEGRFEECAFSSLSTEQFHLSHARLTQCEVSALSAVSLTAIGASLNDVRIASSRCGSAELSESRLDSVLIENCKFGWLNFSAAQLRDVQFVNCQFEEITLGAAQRVRFIDCRADVLAASEARLNAVDLTGLDFGSVQGLNGLRGAQLSEQQVILMSGVMAEHLGIKIAP